jgi:erythromycin esterase-like protein
MRRLLILFIFQGHVLFAQKQIEKFVRNNVFPILTISPDSTNFDDLEIIGTAIGAAQVVMLGEQDHGDAATFLAKSRLIKYLHQKKGFDVLAFESDFFGLNDAFVDVAANDSNIIPVIQNNVLGLWSYCSACNHLLYEYIPSTYNTSHPITITGFDNQTDLVHSRQRLVKKLDSVLRKLELAIIHEVNYKTEILPLLHGLITKYWHQRPVDSVFVQCGKALQIIRDQANGKIQNDSLWSMVIDNMISFNRELQYIKSNKDKAQTIRDEQMYLNLKWLIQKKYTGRKIIVWAANCHILRDKDYKYKTMGSFLSNDQGLADKVYTIGFTSYSGKSGRLYQKKYTISKPKANSFESWINPVLKYGFVDFRTFNTKFPNSNETFNLRHWYYQTEKKQWNTVFDGIYYIRDMYPCESIKKKS